MNPAIEAQILAASQPLHVPGTGERRVLSPVAVERLAAGLGYPRWELEAAALELDVVPLHYLRNLSGCGADGQVRLLRSSAALLGTGPAIERALELLALAGVGRLRVLVPVAAEADSAPGAETAERLARAARNRNGSSEVTSATLALKGGNPVAAFGSLDVVAACLADSAEEQLLQFTCRMARLPLVLGGVQEGRGQATTILPGDAGVALVYKPRHPHLDPSRAGAPVAPKAALMVGAWLAEQVTRLLLGRGDLLRGGLLYADLHTGEMQEYPL